MMIRIFKCSTASSVFAAVLSCGTLTFAADLEAAPPTTAPATQPVGTYAMSDAENAHVNRQDQVLLQQIDAALNANPPAVKVSADRALALSLLDSVLHDPSAPQRSVVGDFRRVRTQRAIADMMQTRVMDDRVVIWEIYNMGFVVRTKSVTLAFDLVELSHVPACALDDATMRSIADQCDALFVTHEHLDHADHAVAGFFLDAGKPVVAPDEMWKGEPIQDRLTHLPRDANPLGHELKILGGKKSLNVQVFPSFQTIKDGTEVQNNVYIVTTPEGFRVAHTGDNNVYAGLPPAGTDGKPVPVDVLIMKLEPGLLRSYQIVRAFAPRLILPAHFEELGHVNVNAREPYWRGLERVPKLSAPSVLMMWGERLDYTRPNS